MATDVLGTLTKFINSPPGVVVAGGVLAGIVSKFFDRVENVLTENTKLDIAVWLLGIKTTEKLQHWPDTFAKIFDRVFGEKHLSWKCFLRSAMASCVAIALTLFVTFAVHNRNWYVAKSIIHEGHLWFFLIVLVVNVIPDYVSLLETRFLLRFASRSSPLDKIGVLCLDFILTLYIGLVSVTYGLSTVLASTDKGLTVSALLSPKVLLSAFNPVELYISSAMVNELGVASLWFYPVFFTSIWLWLYACSGFMLKLARRFDIGFNWFNRHMDIEKKPLQCIGLVAGAIVAVVYWGVVVVHHLLT
jgi:hypothetical protein